MAAPAAAAAAALTGQCCSCWTGSLPCTCALRAGLLTAPRQACLGLLQGHVKGVLALDFSPNGYQLATGGEDNTARIFDLRKRGPLAILPGQPGRQRRCLGVGSPGGWAGSGRPARLGRACHPAFPGIEKGVRPAHSALLPRVPCSRHLLLQTPAAGTCHLTTCPSPPWRTRRPHLARQPSAVRAQRRLLPPDSRLRQCLPPLGARRRQVLCVRGCSKAASAAVAAASPGLLTTTAD